MARINEVFGGKKSQLPHGVALHARCAESSISAGVLLPWNGLRWPLGGRRDPEGTVGISGLEKHGTSMRHRPVSVSLTDDTFMAIYAIVWL